MAQYHDKSEHPESSELNQKAYSEGCAHYENRDFARAKLSFECALEYWPADPQAWFALGNCHDSMNKPARAEACYRMSLKYSAPEALPDIYYNLGNSLFDQEKYRQAMECYVQVDAQNNAYRAAQKNMALAKERLG